MGVHRSPKERKEIVEDYYKSGSSIKGYARDHNIPKTTLLDWIKKYDSLKLSTFDVRGDALFYDITNDVNESVTKDKPITTISSPISTSIKLSTSKFTLEFDVDILNKVLEVFK